MIRPNGSPGRQLIGEADLSQLMDELATVRNRARDLRTTRRIAQEAHDSYKRTQVVMAHDEVANVEATLQIKVINTKGDDGKVKYGNEESRKAGLIITRAESADYREAVGVLRAAEAHLAKLAMAVTEAEDEIKALGDYTWNLRSLIDGARAEIMAVVSLDGPRIPAEITVHVPAGVAIPLTVQGMPAGIQLLAPSQLPAVYLIAKEAA